MEGLGVSDLTSITCTGAGSSIMPLGAAWISDPGGRYWGPGSRESSCKSSLGRFMLEYSLLCHYFARVKFSCLANSELSSTRFFKFPGTVPFLV